MSDAEKINQIDGYLATQRQEWTAKIRELAKAFKDVQLLNEAMVQIPSYRQILIEQIAQLNIKIKQQKARLNKTYKNSYIKYFEYDYKLTDKQKESFLKADMSDDNMVLDLLEVQMDFMRESVKTLDNMGWAVRNKLQLNGI
tara:strand:+ start:6448 stop:6873 length:426 start_codon:yes stop_codon:yes gene_type:complete